MTTGTVLLLLLSAIVAFALSFYQYLFKAGKRTKTVFFLAFLRFVTFFSIFILLINPVITSRSYEIVKTPLPVLVDNSQSIAELGQDSITKVLLEKIQSSKSLQDKFDVQLFTFDEGFETGSAPDFKGKQTHIDQAAQNLKQLYRNRNYPVVLLTDGNQTLGNDYIYSFNQNTTVYPVVLGDTTVYTDLKISQLNVNRYALLKNKFPVEVFLQYNGDKPLKAVFSITKGNTVVHKENVQFNAGNKAKAVTVLLTADKVGVQTYKAVISSTEQERNTYNNSKNFAVEVIDQRTEVALVSAITHPDLGTIKRSVESNRQRKVTLLKPSELKAIDDYNVLILYQPDASFRQLLDLNKNAGLSTWIITGNSTDFSLLNQYQQQLKFRMSAQREDYLADFNSQFNLFALDNIGFEQFPPLEHPFGTITAGQNMATLLQARIRNVKTENPLFAFSETNGKRNAFLLGEGIWKWRMENYIGKKSFDEFDVFIDKTIQFLATNSKRKSLVVNHENFYNSGEVISITAQSFNKNYEFNENARLTIQLKTKADNSVKTYDFLKGTNEYKVNLDGLRAGNYSFTVKEASSNSVYSGSFEVLDFEIEKQFVNPDVTRLKQLAENTTGAVYYPDTISGLIENLINNADYKAIQKERIIKQPLIDWIWLLVLLAVSLAAEWLIRKYNGLL
ncbi:hypothetical protein [Flavobacterium sp. MK4S-17]|uniref:hypothetical protein n=1 Tax=Flavobacterium sp. MK4S-17 TaxID=2543737 RepID=UPI001358085C|nr:hypothetical protein [Flavobacterium sp. MK4S-17]